MINIMRNNDGKSLLIAFISLIFLLSCANKTLVQQEDIAFCTAEAESVKGKLFYKEVVKPESTTDKFWITGKLIFDDLKGWHSKYPVPSFSYWTGEKKSKEPYVNQPKPVYSYWTGNERTVCYIKTLVRIRECSLKKIDPDKLNLEYESPAILNNMIIGPDKKENIKYFKLSYEAKPLAINGIDIVEQEGQNINSGIEIRASFTPQPADTQSELPVETD